MLIMSIINIKSGIWPAINLLKKQVTKLILSDAANETFVSAVAGTVSPTAAAVTPGGPGTAIAPSIPLTWPSGATHAKIHFMTSATLTYTRSLVSEVTPLTISAETPGGGPAAADKVVTAPSTVQIPLIAGTGATIPVGPCLATVYYSKTGQSSFPLTIRALAGSSTQLSAMSVATTVAYLIEYYKGAVPG